MMTSYKLEITESCNLEIVTSFLSGVPNGWIISVNICSEGLLSPQIFCSEMSPHDMGKTPVVFGEVNILGTGKRQLGSC